MIQMFTPEKPLPPPPSAVKSRNESLGAALPTYRNRPSGGGADLSFNSMRSMFETISKPEVRNGLANLAKNPLVQKTAIAVANNPQARSAAISAAQNTSVQQFALRSFTSSTNESSSKPNFDEITRQFESKPANMQSAYSGFTSQSQPKPMFNSTAQSGNGPKQIYPSLSSMDPFDFPPQLPPSPTSKNFSEQLNQKSYWSYNTNSTTPFQTKPKKQPPSRPPPPKIGSRSNPNLVSLAPASPELSTNEPHGLVKYPYKEANQDELSADTNDIVLLKREVDGQWVLAVNTRTGQSGIIPLSFLDIKVPLVPIYNTRMGGLSFSTSDYSNFGQNKCTGQAIYDYDTGVDGDLKFKSGDLITITKRVNQDWLQGELSGRKGIFPFNYITTISGDLTQLPVTDQDQSHTDKPMSINERNQLLLSSLPTVTATFDYCSGVEGDLQFKAGDVIEVVNEHQGNGWIMGKLEGKTGLVPLTYTNRPTKM